MPGRTPAEIRSGVKVCDNQWHHLAARFNPEAVTLYVDGREAAEDR